MTRSSGPPTEGGGGTADEGRDERSGAAGDELSGAVTTEVSGNSHSPTQHSPTQHSPTQHSPYQQAERSVDGPPYWQRRFWEALRQEPRRGIVVGIVAGLVLAVLGGYLVMRGPTTYSSTTVMLIDSPYGIASAGDEGPLLKLNEVRYKYSSLATTYVTALPVARSLGIPVGDVLGHVSATPEADALLMDVTATWPTASGAERLSSAMASQLTSYVQNENTSYAIPVNDQFFLRTVDPTSQAVGSGPSPSKAVTLALGLGLGGLLVGFLVTQVVANRRLLV